MSICRSKNAGCRTGVVKDETVPSHAWIAHSLVGRFWRLDFGLEPVIDGQAFLAFDEPGVAKLVMAFDAQPLPSGDTMLDDDPDLLPGQGDTVADAALLDGDPAGERTHTPTDIAPRETRGRGDCLGSRFMTVERRNRCPHPR